MPKVSSFQETDNKKIIKTHDTAINFVSVSREDIEKVRSRISAVEKEWKLELFREAQLHLAVP